MDVDSFTASDMDASTGGKRKRTLDNGPEDAADMMMGRQEMLTNVAEGSSGQGRMGLMERRESGKVRHKYSRANHYC